MRKRKTNFENLFKVFFVLLFLFSQTSACSAEQLWYEKTKAAPAVKSQDITKAKSAFVDLAKELNPTVVNIFTTHTIKTRGGFGGYSDDMFRMFEEMMGGGRKFYRQAPMVQKATALGSGFIINKGGYIVTNNHVIDGADKIRVKLYDGKEYDAKVVGVDPEIDVALIKINAKKDLPFASLGDSSKIEVGEWVVAIGNPVGQSNTVTAGIISAKGRLVPDVNIYNDFIQTDAAINPGNSGGPLINLNGEVVGINTAINRSMGGIPIEGIGFAVPVDNLKKNLQRMSRGEKIAHKHGWLGVSLGEVNPEVAKSLGLDENAVGAVVTEVMPNTPAEKGGLKTYDVITSFDGKPVKSPIDLTVLIRRADGGKTYVLDVTRNKLAKKISITLGAKENLDEQKPTMFGEEEEDKIQPPKTNKTGIYVQEINSETIRRYRLEGIKPGEGVLVEQVDYDSPAGESGITSGDIILEVNKERVSSEKAFNKAFKSKGTNMFKIKRGDRNIIIAFTVIGNK